MLQMVDYWISDHANNLSKFLLNRKVVERIKSFMFLVTKQPVYLQFQHWKS